VPACPSLGSEGRRSGARARRRGRDGPAVERAGSARARIRGSTPGEPGEGGELRRAELVLCPHGPLPTTDSEQTPIPTAGCRWSPSQSGEGSENAWLPPTFEIFRNPKYAFAARSVSL